MKPAQYPSKSAGAARFRLCAALLGAALLVDGCRRDAEPSTASGPPPDPTIVLGTPQEAARSLVHWLRASLAATARHDRTAADAARDQIVWQIAARDEISSRSGRTPGLPTSQEVRRLNTRVESWAAALAYYADGLNLDHLQLDPGAAASRPVVLIPARGRHDQAVLRVTCVNGPDGRWRVRGLDFGESVPPTTQPATASAPATHP